MNPVAWRSRCMVAVPGRTPSPFTPATSARAYPACIAPMIVAASGTIMRTGHRNHSKSRFHSPAAVRDSGPVKRDLRRQETSMKYPLILAPLIAVACLRINVGYSSPSDLTRGPRFFAARSQIGELMPALTKT